MKPELLFLAHRIPYPPDRGDKIRSWHVLKHLGQFATVHLACFADDEADAAHLPALREAMGGSLGEAFVTPISANKLLWLAKAYAQRLTINEAAMSSAGLQQFVDRIVAERPVAGLYAFSVQMARFVPDGFRRPFVMDFVDFDSAKDIAAAMTPVPGGVGPMTVACLMKNTLAAAEAIESNTAARY